MRQAALELRKNRAYRHPFYWAPFVVIGGGL
jgi:CHAT domain-containing protein